MLDAKRAGERAAFYPIYTDKDETDVIEAGRARECLIRKANSS